MALPKHVTPHRTTEAPVFRFAPSPTGALHLGHARSVLLNQRMARAVGGRLLLRIEDIDTNRLREEHVAWIEEDLAWLGVAFDDVVPRQSTQFDVYRVAAAKLGALGVLYPCFASRTEIAAAAVPDAADPDGAPLYSGLWRGRSPADVASAERAGLPMALRLDMQRALAITGPALTYQAIDSADRVRRLSCHPARWGDVVLVRKETPSSYHLSVVVDDARQGVTHVVRGADLEAATDLHRLLQVLLQLPAPIYHHHELVVDACGRKLSKSAGDTSLRALRAAGAQPHEVRAMAMAGL
jgi:glutamyl-Q tRNA(Asp) synthetase